MSNTRDNVSVPGASDDVFFDGVGTGNSASTILASQSVKSLDMTGYANTLTQNTSVILTVAGNGVVFKLASGMTYVPGSGLAGITFTGTSGTTLITTAGKTPFNIVFNGVGGTFQLQDDLTITNNFTRTNGTFDPNGKTVSLTGTSGTLTGSSSFYNLTRTGAANTTSALTLAADQTVTHTLTLTGNSAANRLLISSDTRGITRTITNTGATMTWSFVDFRDISLSTPYDASTTPGGSGDAGGNSGITFTPAQTNYWVGGTGNWNNGAFWKLSNHTTAGRVPLPQDDVRFDASSFTSGSQTVTANESRLGKNIDWTGVTNTPTWIKTTATENYGSITLVSGMINSGTTAYTMAGRGAYTFTSAGQIWTNPLTIAMISGTTTLQDAFNSSATTTLTNGGFDANISNVIAPAFVITGTNARTLALGTGTWTATTTNGNAWDATATTSLTIIPGSSTITISDIGSASKTFVGGGMTYNNITFSGDNITVSGTNTFSSFAVNNAGLTNGLKLTSGTKQTVTSFSTNGSNNNLAKLLTTASGVATLSKSSGTVSVDYMSIASSTVTGGATWYAGSHSTNVGNNTGWLFSSPSSMPTVTTNIPSSVASSSMIMNGSIAVDGSASSTVRGFAWGTNSGLSGGDTATTTESGTFGVSSFSTTTINMTPSTVYYFRAYAVNTAGTSTGSILSTTTLPWSLPFAPTSVSATPSNHQASITFTAGSNGGAPILYYLASSTPGNITATSSGSPIVVSGLTNGISYTFQVYAVNAVGTSSASTASSAVTPSNLVLDMPFDSDSPPSVADNSSYGNNGTINGATATTSCFNGSCYSFDGASNNISVANSASLNPSSAITISAWVKPIGKGTTSSDSLGVVSKTGSYNLGIRQDGTITFYLTGVNNWVTTFGNNRTLSDKDLFDGVWHNIVATYDGATQAVYIDGFFIASTTSTGNITSSSNAVSIGSGSGSAFFEGGIDNLRLYNSGFTQSDVQTLYSSYGQIHNSPRTYYISSSSGNDNNDGLSTATPWKNADMIYKEGSIPNLIAPGDSVLLKRGDTWDSQIKVDHLGSTTLASITIGAYGTASDPKPLIYGDGRNLVWTAVAGHSGVYQADMGVGGLIYGVYENNTAYSYLSDPLSLTPGTWGNPNGLANMIWIYTSDGNQPSNIRVFKNNVITVKNSNNIVIRDINIQEAGVAGTVRRSDSITMRNIDTLNSQNSSTVFVSDTNSIMDTVNATSSGNTVFYIFGGSNNIIRNSTIYGVSDTISGVYSPGNDNAGIGLQQGKGDLIEHNKIYNALSAALDYYDELDSIVRYNYVEGTAGFYPHGSNNIVYGNIVNGIGTKAAFNISGVPSDYLTYNTYGNDGGPLPNKILNNTFYNIGWYGMMANSGPSNGPIIRNNIIYANANIKLTDYTDTPTLVDSDYNCFYAPSTPRWNVNGASIYSFSDFQATGHDPHSVYGNPQLDANYNLGAGSSCKDVGVNVSGLINFPYIDYAGVSIPQGSAPDAGAFELLSNVPNTPTSVSATAGNHQATVTFTPGSNGGSSILYYLASSTPGNITATSTGSPITVTSLTNGTTYTFQVYAVNAVGPSSPSTASASITLDGTAPTTSAFLPGGTYGTAQSVTLTCTDNVGGVGCDKTYYTTNGSTPTTGSTQYSGAISIPSNTTLKFFSTDLNGNTESTETEVYVIDSTYPFTTITPSSVSATTSTGITFNFSANKAGSTYECKLDSASFASCTSPQSLSGLADGSHTFTIRATDTLSHVEPSPAFVIWLIDTTPPNAFTLSLPADNTSIDSTQPNLIWNASADSGSGLTKYQLFIDGSLDTDNIAANTTASMPSSALSRITHSWYVKALDLLGNTTTSNTFHFTINPLPTLPTLSVPTASGISQTSAILNGGITDDGNASSTVEGFNYGTSQSYEGTASTNGAFGIGSFNQTISDLTCGITYHFQSFATNSSGTQTSSDQTFTTSVCTVTTTLTPVIQSSSSGGGTLSAAQLAALLAPSASTTAYINSLATSTVPGCPVGVTCTPSAIPNCQTTASTATSFTRPLILGSTGSDVRALQVFLNSHGFTVSTYGNGSSGHETTYYGPATASAVSSFQNAYATLILTPSGLTHSTGYFGPATMKEANLLSVSTASRVCLTPIALTTPPVSTAYSFTRDLTLGSQGNDVKALQVFLNTHAFTITSTGAGSPGNETIYFGPATQTALIKFQKANGINPATGYFGPVTMKKMNAFE